MGSKTILNEFVAYLQMAALPAGALSPGSQLIMLYAMCGFANFGSLGIMIGGLGTMCPERRAEIAGLSRTPAPATDRSEELKIARG